MEKLYSKANQVVNYLQNDQATSLEEIERALKHFKINASVLTRDEFLNSKIKNGDRFIVNTVNQGMGHWVGVYVHDNEKYLFCCDGYSFDQLFKNKGGKPVTKKYQDAKVNELCGQLSTGWLMLTKQKNEDWKKL